MKTGPAGCSLDAHSRFDFLLRSRLNGSGLRIDPTMKCGVSQSHFQPEKGWDAPIVAGPFQDYAPPSAPARAMGGKRSNSGEEVLRFSCQLNWTTL